MTMNKITSIGIWIFIILTSAQLIIMDRRIKKIERIIQESLDNQPTEIKIEGDWKEFGKLTFNDRVWVDE